MKQNKNATKRENVATASKKCKTHEDNSLKKSHRFYQQRMLDYFRALWASLWWKKPSELKPKVKAETELRAWLYLQQHREDYRQEIVQCAAPNYQEQADDYKPVWNKTDVRYWQTDYANKQRQLVRSVSKRSILWRWVFRWQYEHRYDSYAKAKRLCQLYKVNQHLFVRAPQMTGVLEMGKKRQDKTCNDDAKTIELTELVAEELPNRMKGKNKLKQSEQKSLFEQYLKACCQQLATTGNLAVNFSPETIKQLMQDTCWNTHKPVLEQLRTLWQDYHKAYHTATIDIAAANLLQDETLIKEKSKCGQTLAQEKINAITTHLSTITKEFPQLVSYTQTSISHIKQQLQQHTLFKAATAGNKHYYENFETFYLICLQASLLTLLAKKSLPENVTDHLDTLKKQPTKKPYVELITETLVPQLTAISTLHETLKKAEAENHVSHNELHTRLVKTLFENSHKKLQQSYKLFFPPEANSLFVDTVKSYVKTAVDLFLQQLKLNKKEQGQNKAQNKQKKDLKQRQQLISTKNSVKQTIHVNKKQLSPKQKDKNKHTLPKPVTEADPNTSIPSVKELKAKSNKTQKQLKNLWNKFSGGNTKKNAFALTIVSASHLKIKRSNELDSVDTSQFQTSITANELKKDTSYYFYKAQAIISGLRYDELSCCMKLFDFALCYFNDDGELSDTLPATPAEFQTLVLQQNFIANANQQLKTKWLNKKLFAKEHMHWLHPDKATTPCKPLSEKAWKDYQTSLAVWQHCLEAGKVDIHTKRSWIGRQQSKTYQVVVEKNSSRGSDELLLPLITATLYNKDKATLLSLREEINNTLSTLKEFSENCNEYTVVKKGLFDTQTKLGDTQTELGDTQTKLGDTQTELDKYRQHFGSLPKEGLPNKDEDEAANTPSTSKTKVKEQKADTSLSPKFDFFLQPDRQKSKNEAKQERNQTRERSHSF